MGRNGVYIHSLVILILYIWLAILSLSVTEESRKKGLLVLMFGLVLCVAVVGLLYVGDPKNSASDLVIFGIHGKYFTPYLFLLCYGLGTLSPFKISSNKTYLGMFTVLLMIFTSILSIYTYSVALT